MSRFKIIRYHFVSYFVLVISCFSGLIFTQSLFLPGAARAADPITFSPDTMTSTKLSVAPSIHEAVITPSRESHQVFELTNQSAIPIPVKAYVRSFDAADEIGGVTIDEEIDQARLKITSWVSIQNPDFIIQPNQTVKTLVTFNPPADLPPGGYYGIVFFEPLLPESFVSENSLQIGGRIGSLLFLVASGDMKEKGELVSFSASRYHWRLSPASLNVRFKNDGNVHLRPKLKMSVQNLITKSQRQGYNTEFTVLPKKIRQATFYVKDMIWPGVYKADLSLTYSRDKILIKDDQIFLYFPWEYIALLIILGLFLTLVFSKKGRTKLVRMGQIILRGQ